MLSGFVRKMTKSWLFLKKFQTSLLISSESTLLLSAAWVVLQSKESMFQRIFLKKSQFIVISDEKKTILKTPFQPKSPWNGPFADSLGKLWTQSHQSWKFCIENHWIYKIKCQPICKVLVKPILVFTKKKKILWHFIFVVVALWGYCRDIPTD